jgi:hypothetical protein
MNILDFADKHFAGLGVLIIFSLWVLGTVLTSYFNGKEP